MFKVVSSIVLLIGVLVGVHINSFYLPEDFERPFLAKQISFASVIICQLAKLGNALGIKSEAHIIRDLSDLIQTNKYTDQSISTEDRVINQVRVRIYKKTTTEPDNQLPILIYYHGGGFFFKNLDIFDLYLFQFVKRLNMVVVSVDYKMAPEHPYPQPTEDCYMITKYIMEHPNEFNADLSRLVLAGDSSGGNTVAVTTQRLLREKLPHQPKIQVLIYPWVDLFDLHLPSHEFYRERDLAGIYRTPVSRVVSWYLGHTNSTKEVEEAFDRNELYALIEDKKERDRIIEIMDYKKIPNEFRPIGEYYETPSRKISTELDQSSVFRKDKNLAQLYKKVLDPSISPILAQSRDLVGLPKAYFISVEWDDLKDEGLLYAQRLKEAGVDVQVAFYEKAYHCIVVSIDTFRISRKMQNDLIEYLKLNL